VLLTMKRVLTMAGLVCTVACTKAATETDAGTDAGVVMDFSTGRKILAFLEGKTLLMTGHDLPPYPFGMSEVFDLGADTQCYRAITIRVVNGAFGATVEKGLLSAPGDAGRECDHTTTTSTTSFSSTPVLIDNVMGNGSCFDVTVDYGAFGEEGRGQMAPDGSAVTLELYFRGRASQHRCEDGVVGSGEVNLIIGSADAGRLAHPAGDTSQMYRIQ